MKLRLELSEGSYGDFSIDLAALSIEIERRLDGMLDGVNASVAVTCVPDGVMKELNARYRGMDEATDVLSFPLWEEERHFSPPPGWKDLPLGDVVAAPDFVRHNAERENTVYNYEMARMIVHGVLHLAGFDHDTAERREEMWALQESIVEDYARFMGGLMTE